MFHTKTFSFLGFHSGLAGERPHKRSQRLAAWTETLKIAPVYQKPERCAFFFFFCNGGGGREQRGDDAPQLVTAHLAETTFSRAARPAGCTV